MTAPVESPTDFTASLDSWVQVVSDREATAQHAQGSMGSLSDCVPDATVDTPQSEECTSTTTLRVPSDERSSSRSTLPTAHSEPLTTCTEKLKETGLVQVAFVVDRARGTYPHLSELTRRLPGVTTDLQQSLRVSIRFALFVYGNNRLTIVHPVFVTLDTIYQSLSNLNSEKPRSGTEDCFAALLAAANELKWSAPQRMILWMGDGPRHRAQYTTLRDQRGGSKHVAQVMSQELIRCAFLEVEPRLTRYMVDTMRSDFADAGITHMDHRASHVREEHGSASRVCFSLIASPPFMDWSAARDALHCSSSHASASRCAPAL